MDQPTSTHKTPVAAPSLPAVFYTMPDSASATFTTKDLRALLLSHDGWIMACGQGYDIVSKPIGAGVHRVSLKLRAVSR